MIRRTVLTQLPYSRSRHLFIVSQSLSPPLELPRHRFDFVHKQNHDVHGRMPEMNPERRVGKLSPEFAHPVDKKFQALDLNVRSRKAVDNGAMLILRAK